MFTTLTERLSKAANALRGRGRLTEDNIAETLREVRMALLEADVALPVVNTFIEAVKTQALGTEVLGSLSPGQAFIGLRFLEHLQQKYNFTNLVNVIHNRADRCGLERIMGLLFTMEYPQLKIKASLFGDIVPKSKSFGYSYEQYIYDLNRKKKVLYPFVKVWSGR